MSCEMQKIDVFTMYIPDAQSRTGYQEKGQRHSALMCGGVCDLEQKYMEKVGIEWTCVHVGGVCERHDR